MQCYNILHSNLGCCSSFHVNSMRRDVTATGRVRGGGGGGGGGGFFNLK